MPISPRTFHVVVCDTCGLDDEEVIALHETREDAVTAARRAGWIIAADRTVTCPRDDHQHRAAIDALMPPEPPIQIDGQLPLDLR
ncbi:hypothetical protein [Kitasatospora sp. NPDC094015]|uniref:hypothetical protein n=1 Tax=Kitasatospora sp. NPDC094015 TaxID=3155205 RepID=UPI00332236FA